MKFKSAILVCFILAEIALITWIEYHIQQPDLRFYSGKDDGYFVRIESITLSTSMFYGLINLFNYQNFMKLIVSILSGFLIALLLCVPGYFITIDFQFSGLFFHLTTICLSFSTIFIAHKLLKN